MIIAEFKKYLSYAAMVYDGELVPRVAYPRCWTKLAEENSWWSEETVHMSNKQQQVWDYYTNFENKANNKLAIALRRIMRQQPGGVNPVNHKEQCALFADRGRQVVAWREKQNDVIAASRTNLLEVPLPERPLESVTGEAQVNRPPPGAGEVLEPDFGRVRGRPKLGIFRGQKEKLQDKENQENEHLNRLQV
jgi:hypothetical protein